MPSDFLGGGGGGFDWQKLAQAGASLGPQPATPGAQAGVADQMQAMQRQRRENEMWELLKKRMAAQKMQAGQMPDLMPDLMGQAMPPMGGGF